MKCFSFNIGWNQIYYKPISTIINQAIVLLQYKNKLNWKKLRLQFQGFAEKPAYQVLLIYYPQQSTLREQTGCFKIHSNFY